MALTSYHHVDKCHRSFPSAHLDGIHCQTDCMTLRSSHPETVLCSFCYGQQCHQLSGYDFDIPWGKPFVPHDTSLTQTSSSHSQGNDVSSIVPQSNLLFSSPEAGNSLVLPHGPTPPPALTSLQHANNAFQVNVTLQQALAESTATVPMQVHTILQELRGKCLVCWRHSCSATHPTSQCKGTDRWSGWRREGSVGGDFAWKRARFINSTAGDTRGYCWKCLLNPDWQPVHRNSSTHGCLFPDMIFEMIWIIAHSDELRSALATQTGDPTILTMDGFVEWCRRRFNGDKKWRNFSTQLVLFFYHGCRIHVG
jgi:hypothetical protein